MNANNDKEKSSSNSSKGKRKRKVYNKWTFWPTLIAILFSLNFIIIIGWFISEPAFFTSAKEVVPSVWAAVVTLLTIFGVVNARKTSLLRLLRLPPIGSIIVLYTIITLAVSFYIIAVKFEVHCVNIMAKYDGKVMEGIDIYWQNEKKGPTDANGFYQISKVKVGDYQLKASYGTVSDSHQVQIGWWPLTKQDSIFLKPVKRQEFGSLYITTTLNGTVINGAEIFLNNERQNINSPDTLTNLRVSDYEYELKAVIVISGKVYLGTQTVRVQPIIVKPVNLSLEFQSNTPAELNIKLPADGASIILKNRENRVIIRKESPLIKQELPPGTYNIKIRHIVADHYYEYSDNVELEAGESESKTFNLSLIGKLVKVYIQPVGTSVKIGDSNYGDQNPISLVPGTYTFIGSTGVMKDTITKVINRENDEVRFNFN
jgi:hypothetical protein